MNQYTHLDSYPLPIIFSSNWNMSRNSDDVASFKQCTLLDSYPLPIIFSSNWNMSRNSDDVASFKQSIDKLQSIITEKDKQIGVLEAIINDLEKYQRKKKHYNLRLRDKPNAEEQTFIFREGFNWGKRSRRRNQVKEEKQVIIYLSKKLDLYIVSNDISAWHTHKNRMRDKPDNIIVQFVNRMKNEKKWKCVIFKCYSSEDLITLNTLHEVVPTWYSFHSWVDWSNADKVSCSRRKRIDAEVRTHDLCIQNRHSNHYTNCSIPCQKLMS